MSMLLQFKPSLSACRCGEDPDAARQAAQNILSPCLHLQASPQQSYLIFILSLITIKITGREELVGLQWVWHRECCGEAWWRPLPGPSTRRSPPPSSSSRTAARLSKKTSQCPWNSRKPGTSSQLPLWLFLATLKSSDSGKPPSKAGLLNSANTFENINTVIVFFFLWNFFMKHITFN